MNGEGPSAPKPRPKEASDLLQGEYLGVRSRGLTQETARKFGYRTVDYRGQQAWAANYRDTSGAIVAQKVRTKDKDFTVLGTAKRMTFFGQHLWSRGKKIVITEGEIDCMTVSQLQDHKWPTVSLPQGAAGARRSIKDNWDYLNGFEEVILMFDMDEAGQKAAQEVAEMLPVGKAKIARLPLKDANECLLKGEGGAIINAVWQAREYRPDGIVSASDLRELVTKPEVQSDIVYPFPRLNEITKGIRRGELVTVTAGSGIGKTTLCSEVAMHLHSKGQRIGLIMLEESNQRTLRNLIGIHLSKNLTVDPEAASTEEVEGAFDELFGSSDRPVYLYDHFGSTDVDLVCNRIRFMAKALDVDYVILDHISILVSGLATGDERKLIDMAMTKLRTLVQEIDIGLILVSHLRRPEGDRGHEDGAKVRLGQLRGSHAIAQLSDICLSLQVDPEDPHSNVRHLFVLKNRFTGQTGPADTLVYDQDTGRLKSEQSPF
jgi:twinkle protein